MKTNNSMAFRLPLILGIGSLFHAFACESLLQADFMDTHENSLGIGNRITTIAAFDDDTVYPVADAYVWGGAQANTNYGSSARLQCRYHSDAAYHRQSYMKFDLTGQDATYVRAVLNLYVDSTSTGTVFELYGVADDGWTEAGITWNTKPLAGDKIATVSGASPGWVSVDISHYVTEELQGDKTASFLIASPTTSFVYIHSKEGTNVPYLSVSSKPKAASVLMQKGLAFVWQDQLHLKDGTGDYVYTDPNDLFQPNRGRRSGAIQSERRSFVLDGYVGDRVLQVDQLTNGLRNECYATGWWPQQFKEFGMAVDLFIPAGIDLDATNAYDGVRTDGKTAFGIQVGESGLDNPDSTGFSSSYPAVSQVCLPENQRGAVCFMNWAWNKSSGNVSFRWYHYAVRKNGVLRTTTSGDGLYGYVEPSFVVPKGRWITLTNYVKMDTDGTDGVLESWITDRGVSTRVSHITGLDFGSAVIDRGIATGNGTLVGTAGGWHAHSTYAAEMVGGTIYEFITGASPFYKAYNIRVYGKE